jgi:hypothetical protein
MNIQKPKNWRTGQSIFNFLEWLRIEKKYNSEESVRMADPFNLTDTEFSRLYKEFLNALK